MQTGAHNLVAALKAHGLTTYFANPGTSEMQLVSAIGGTRGVRSILALFEGVATGAADGFARMTGTPAGCLLHLGPGFGNGWANLHNASRAHSPVLAIVGDHATGHLALDAPLTSNLEGLSSSVSQSVLTAGAGSDLAQAGSAALNAAYAGGGSISTLIVPSDLAWSEAARATEQPETCTPDLAPVSDAMIDRAVAALKGPGRRILLVGGRALRGTALDRLGQIAEVTGAELIAETFTARAERGAGRVPLAKLNYFGEAALDQLSGAAAIVTVGAKPPVSFFAYPDRPSRLVPEGCALIDLAGPASDVDQAIDGLMSGLKIARGAPPSPHAVRVVPDRPTGPLDAEKCWRVLARLAPEGMILSEEAATSSLGLDLHMQGAAPFDHLQLTGGSIGQSLPVALGAAVAAPDRKTVCATGDGGAMYTAQALWTMAREELDVVIVVFANRSYAILNIELMRVGAHNPGPEVLDMLDIGRPDLNFVQLANAMGVEAAAAETAERFETLLLAALSQKGPFLIEAVL